VNDRFKASFDSALETPALARHELESWLPSSVAESVRGALRLLVSELVTNSVRHVSSTQPVELAVRIGPRAIRVEARGADGGFGLFLVERMASRWGVDTQDGTRVWFELDLAPGGR
jgi:anti-sigma regulatory factor (Ser/Thr protein kinase)